MNTAEQGTSGTEAGFRYLLPETVSLVLACINGSTVGDEEIPILVRDVHSALLDIAADSGGFAIPGPVPVAEQSDGAAEEALMAAVLDRIGAGAAATVTFVTSAQAGPSATTVPEGLGETVPGSGVGPVEGDAGAGVLALEIPFADSRIPDPAPVRPRKPKKAARKPAKAAKPRPVPAEPEAPRLPKGVSSVDEALGMDSIICLDDGRKVRDLRAHLAAKGGDFDAYRKKWSLPEAYPSMAPSSIVKKGVTFEYDLVTGRFRELR